MSFVTTPITAYIVNHLGVPVTDKRAWAHLRLPTDFTKGLAVFKLWEDEMPVGGAYPLPGVPTGGSTKSDAHARGMFGVAAMCAAHPTTIEAVGLICRKNAQGTGLASFESGYVQRLNIHYTDGRYVADISARWHL
jgi:hypothetical protein